MRTLKRKSTVSELDRLQAEAFRQYLDSGELTGLAVLADYLDECNQSPEFAQLLRRTVTAADPDIHFFYVDSGLVATERRLESALALAEAEDTFEDHEDVTMKFYWEIDEDYDPTDYDYPADVDFAWGGVLEVLKKDREGREYWEVAESLWSVTFAGDGYPHSDPYARVVRAEIVLSALS